MIVNRYKNVLLLCVVGGCLIMQGCVVGPDYKKPEVELADTWHSKFVEQYQNGDDPAGKWWQNLQDPILDELIEKAKTGNLDVETAIWRVRQARYQRDFTTGKFDPTVDGIGSYDRFRRSENGLVPPDSGSADQMNLHSVGLDASWEIDLFGQNRRLLESDQAQFEAEIENLHKVMVSLYSEVALNYIDLRSFQERIKYALENIKSQAETLKLTEARFNAEIAPELDVEQAKLNLTNTKAQVPTLRIAESQTINRISVLLGQQPGEITEHLSKFGKIPTAKDTVAKVLPAELLRQRPDIREAERRLASQNARIGFAKADLYPSFTLDGVFQMQAMNFNDLGLRGSRAYSFGPAFRWNIFSGGRIKNSIKIEEAKTKQLYAIYENTVLNALEEVENAFLAYGYEKQRNILLAESVESAKKSAELVQTLYKNGLTDFQNVLDMQRALFVQQDSLAESKGQVTSNFIRIYKAFGGGWQDQSDIKTVK